MKVGIIGGTGPLGRGLALRLAAAGAQVVVGSRSAERAAATVAGAVAPWGGHRMSLAGASNAEAAEAEIVVAATPWEGAVETLAPLASGLAEKVVVSVGNALLKSGGEMHALVPPRGSVAQLVQSALPDSMVAAAFHHLPAHDLLDLARPMEGDVLVCSDQPEAKKSTLELVSLLGGLRGLDAGSLSQAGAIEAFTAVLVTLNMRYRCHATVRIGGIDPGATGGGR